MNTRWIPLAALAIIAIPSVLPGQSAGTPAVRLAAATGDCLATDLSSQLQNAHPLGTGRRELSACSATIAWDHTAPLDAEKTRVWTRAIGVLLDSASEACRSAGTLLKELHGRGRVSVWTAPDTANGIVFYGATYLAPDRSTIAVQFWAPTFQRDFGWIVAALAHEGFHALNPDAGEEGALDFGTGCARPLDRSAPITTGSP